MAVNACLGSWFFGYNLGVYSSAQLVISKINSWDSDTSDDNAALVTAFMPLGALIGALFSRQIIDFINGIRKSMMIFDIIGIIGTIILIVDSTLPNLLVGRFVCGFCIGNKKHLIYFSNIICFFSLQDVTQQLFLSTLRNFLLQRSLAEQVL